MRSGRWWCPSGAAAASKRDPADTLPQGSGRAGIRELLPY